MAVTKRTSQSKYDISDLGYLDQSRDENLDVVLRLGVQTLNVPMGFISFVDPLSGHVSQKAVCGGPQMPGRAAQEMVVNRVVAHGAPIFCGDVLKLAVTDVSCLRLRGFAGAPVTGPAGEIVGAVVLADHTARAWTLAEEAALTDVAHVVSQQILLKAALLTLKLIVRHPPGPIVHNLSS